MKNEKRLGLKTTGIHIIGFSFLLGAISKLFLSLIEPGRSSGFLGFSFKFLSGHSPESMTIQFDIMAWIGVSILGYTGYHLLKHNQQGRILALIILGVNALSLFYMTITLASSSGAVVYWVSIYSDSSTKVDKSIALAVTFTVFLLHAIPIYFLMRNDVKAEFKSQIMLHAQTEEQTKQ